MQLTSARVKRMTYFKIDLEKVRRVANAFTHHFIEMETEDGHVFTFEKDKVCILVQSCPPSTAPFALREYRGYDKRKKLKTLEQSDQKLLQDLLLFSVGSVIQWIFKNRLVFEDYDLHLSNCQHFARGIWKANEFSPVSSGEQQSKTYTK